MKIGILTHPPRRNYGGIMQTWALQQVLLRMGHEPVTIDISRLKPGERLHDTLKAVARKVLHTANRAIPTPHTDDRRYSSMLTFVYTHVRRLDSHISELAEKTASLDAFIVGSDQVWRPCFTFKPKGMLEAMFLDFLPSEARQRIISYGASFGVDEWEFSQAQTEMAKRLISRFHAVSVREASGVNLCAEHLNAPARQVLDPTLLIGAEEYRALIPGKAISGGGLGVFVLDPAPEKQQLADILGRKLSLTPHHIGRLPKRGKYPSVEEWLMGFSAADYILTDSFHGTVFAIIMRKPFIVIGNEARGSGRFTSLLYQFGLEERLRTPRQAATMTTDDLSAPIDWEAVSAKINDARKTSLDFLTQALS